MLFLCVVRKPGKTMDSSFSPSSLILIFKENCWDVYEIFQKKLDYERYNDVLMRLQSNLIVSYLKREDSKFLSWSVVKVTPIHNTDIQLCINARAVVSAIMSGIELYQQLFNLGPFREPIKHGHVVLVAIGRW